MAPNIRIAFHTSKGWLGSTVALLTGGPYDHVEIVFPDGLSWSSSFVDKGSRFAEIEFNPDRWDFVDLTIAGDKVLLMRAMAEQLNGRPYGVAKVMNFVSRALLNKEFPDPKGDNSLFCSEAVALVLAAGGVLGSLPPRTTAPIHLAYALWGWKEASNGRTSG